MIIRGKSIEKSFADSTLIQVVVDNSIGPGLDSESKSGEKMFFVYCDASCVYTKCSKIHLSLVMWLEGKKEYTCHLQLLLILKKTTDMKREVVFVSYQETKRLSAKDPGRNVWTTRASWLIPSEKPKGSFRPITWPEQLFSKASFQEMTNTITNLEANIS